MLSTKPDVSLNTLISPDNISYDFETSNKLGKILFRRGSYLLCSLVRIRTHKAGDAKSVHQRAKGSAGVKYSRYFEYVLNG